MVGVFCLPWAGLSCGERPRDAEKLPLEDLPDLDGKETVSLGCWLVNSWLDKQLSKQPFRSGINTVLLLILHENKTGRAGAPHWPEGSVGRILFTAPPLLYWHTPTPGLEPHWTKAVLMMAQRWQEPGQSFLPVTVFVPDVGKWPKLIQSKAYLFLFNIERRKLPLSLWEVGGCMCGLKICIPLLSSESFLFTMVRYHEWFTLAISFDPQPTLWNAHLHPHFAEVPRS